MARKGLIEKEKRRRHLVQLKWEKRRFRFLIRYFL